MSSPSAGGAQKMPPQKRRRVRCRRVARRDRWHVPVPPVASARHRRRLLAAPRQGSDRRPRRGDHRGPGSSELAGAPEPHAGARARPPVAAPRDLDSAFPRGPLASASLFFLPRCLGALLASGLPHRLFRTAAPKELLPAPPVTDPRPLAGRDAPALPAPSCRHPGPRRHWSGAG